jgi:glucose dehydrogenase
MTEITLSQTDQGQWQLYGLTEKGAVYTELVDTFEDGIERIKELMLR